MIPDNQRGHIQTTRHKIAQDIAPAHVGVNKNYCPSEWAFGFHSCEQIL